jgi:hypothetical protein
VLNAQHLMRRAVVIVALLASIVSGGQAVAQVGQPTGPGQAVPLPPAQCPATFGCMYGERNFLPNGYRVQRLEVCGANCTTQYWVTTIPDGQLLLSIDPVRGGGVISVKAASILQDPHPPLRTILPDYQPSDSACCPSQYADTTYTWDQRSGALLAGAPSIIAAADFNGWDDVRAGLQADGFFDVFP